MGLGYDLILFFAFISNGTALWLLGVWLIFDVKVIYII